MKNLIQFCFFPFLSKRLCSSPKKFFSLQQFHSWRVRFYLPTLKLAVEYLPLVGLKLGIFCAFSIPGTGHIYISLINGSSTLTPFVILVPKPKQCLSALSLQVRIVRTEMSLFSSGSGIEPTTLVWLDLLYRQQVSRPFDRITQF